MKVTCWPPATLDSLTLLGTLLKSKASVLPALLVKVMELLPGGGLARAWRE